MSLGNLSLYRVKTNSYSATYNVSCGNPFVSDTYSIALFATDSSSGTPLASKTFTPVLGSVVSVTVDGLEAGASYYAFLHGDNSGYDSSYQWMKTTSANLSCVTTGTTAMFSFTPEHTVSANDYRIRYTDGTHAGQTAVAGGAATFPIGTVISELSENTSYTFDWFWEIGNNGVFTTLEHGTMSVSTNSDTPKMATDWEWRNLADRVNTMFGHTPSDVVVGEKAYSDGANSNVVIGYSTRVNSGTGVVAIGAECQTQFFALADAVMLGWRSKVHGNFGIAIGALATAGDSAQTQASDKKEMIAIGHSAKASAADSTAIGYSAKASARGSVAIGANSSAATTGQMDIGSTSTFTGYNSTKYRLLTGVYTPQSDHDAANKEYVDTKQAKMLVGSALPTSSTVGEVGQLYYAAYGTGYVYICVSAQNGEYTWLRITTSGGGGGGN